MQAATRAASTVAEDTERALADRVRDALAVLDQRPDGHLPRPYRRAIQVLIAAEPDGRRRPHDAPEAIPEDQDDWDVDACGWDTAYLASQAEASWPGAQDDDPEARRAFRRWYLEEALPATLREP